MSAYARELQETARAIVAPSKGILAMDESNGTCNKRFEKRGIPATEESRRAYRQLILTAPNLADYINGPILYDETIRQSTDDGVPFIDLVKDAGMILGIKVDESTIALAGYPDEKVTEGLDGLRDRLAEYYDMGARFAKWRSVITIGDGIPSRACIEANAHGLARYAALCQEAGLVPIVEPEVLINGDHTIERCFEVTDATLHEVFDQLYTQGVDFEGMVLKPNMVLSGADCPTQAGVDEVADATIACLRKNVPATVAGIAFLSGGQSEERASAHLNAMNAKFASECPWPVTFSFSRAIQQSALDCWSEDRDNNVEAAQEKLVYRAKCNSQAVRGEYTGDE